MPARLGSLGNFPTEDLVTMLAEMGVETGIDPERVVATSKEIARILGADPQSHRGNGVTRKSVMELASSNPNMRYSCPPDCRPARFPPSPPPRRVFGKKPRRVPP